MVVYPHWRGELEPCQNGASFVPGLSPLPRGTRFAGRYHRAGKRFIPAGAGNSFSISSASAWIAVYPRWHGELNGTRLLVNRPHGLSPLARGTRYIHATNIHNQRFIPAGAGNSKIQSIADAAGTVYPRWRGELRQLSDRSATNFGLSPLARGTLQTPYGPRRASRFIPAGAGNSCCLTAVVRTRPVYPRWRGELARFRLSDAGPGGLSPLARGTLANFHIFWRCPRFIPAGAGNSSPPTFFSYFLAVYPRWRGELFAAGVRPSRGLGLSPLARGTPVVPGSVLTGSRFIPAGAGNSEKFRHQNIPLTVYPRWRGELN